MLLSVVRARARAGAVPERPIVLCFTADEEAGGHHGAAGARRASTATQLAHCTEAVGEVGGFSTTVRGQRLYLIEAAEKGMAWMRLTARGRAGHGSMINRRQRRHRLAAAVARIGAHEWPVRLTPTMQTLLAAVAEMAGTEATPDNAEALVEEFGGAARMLGAVHPQHHQPDDARRRLQGERDPDRGHGARRRPVPAGLRGRVLRHHRRAVRRGRRAVDFVSHQQPWETPYDGDLVDAMTRSPARRGPRRRRRAVPDERRHRRQALQQARAARLRLHPAAAARRPRLHRALPRGRRAGAGRRAGVRGPGLRPVPRPRSERPDATAGVVQPTGRSARAWAAPG